METKNSERLTYTVVETARLLGISRITAYTLAKQGRLPVIRISDRRLVVPRKALERMLEGGHKVGGQDGSETASR